MAIYEKYMSPIIEAINMPLLLGLTTFPSYQTVNMSTPYACPLWVLDQKIFRRQVTIRYFQASAHAYAP